MTCQKIDRNALSNPQSRHLRRLNDDETFVCFSIYFNRCQKYAHHAMMMNWKSLHKQAFENVDFVGAARWIRSICICLPIVKALRAENDSTTMGITDFDKINLVKIQNDCLV